MTMPDRWDAKALGLVGCTCYWARGWGSAHALTCALVKVAELARRAYREGLERARGIALDIAGEYPEDIFYPITPGELADTGSLGDRIGAHMARVTARNIAAAIRREIEGA